MEKTATFGPKPWTKPFRKTSIFGLFELLDFFRVEKRFPVLEYISYNKKMEEMTNLNQSHGLTPLEKSQFSQCLNFLIFFSLGRRCFVLEYRKTHFLAYIA